MRLFAGLTFGAVLLLQIALLVLGAAMWIQGIVLAFQASLILGLVCLLLEVPFPIFALVYWFGHVDLAQRIAHAFPQIFGT